VIELKPSIVCGIEIEMEYNAHLMKIKKANYHEEYDDREDYLWVGDSEKFIAERDGSLGVYQFAEGECVELISIPFLIENGMNIVKDFANQFGAMTGQKLDEYICFNDSTGAHIHLSLLNSEKEGYTNIDLRDHIRHKFKGKPMFFRDIVGISILNKIKERLIERAKAILSEDAFAKWSSALIRGFAAKIEDENQMYEDRRSEWNLTLHNRIEYRGFNLRGITTWGEFLRIYELLFSTIKEVIYEEFESKRPFFNQSAYELLSDDCSGLLSENSAVFDIGLEQSHKRRRYEVELPNALEPEVNFVIDMNSSPEWNADWIDDRPYWDEDKEPDEDEGGN
jgi:hypothetical protein